MNPRKLRVAAFAAAERANQAALYITALSAEPVVKRNKAVSRALLHCAYSLGVESRALRALADQLRR